MKTFIDLMENEIDSTKQLKIDLNKGEILALLKNIFLS